MNMTRLRNLQHRIRALFAKRLLDAEMDEEMRSHIEMQTQENIANGIAPEEARYAALRQFGHVEGLKEAARDQREGFIVRHVSLIAQDLRFSARMLRKHPFTNAVIVLTIALLGARLIALGGVPGLLIGMSASAGLLGVFENGSSAFDLVTCTIVIVVVGASGLLASYFPARKASQLNPMTALRY